MGLRGWLKRLERAASGELIEIPQRDGSVKRFTERDLRNAFVNLTDRMGAGEDAPPEHPVLEAVGNSDDPKWRKSFFAVGNPEAHIEPVEDLSE